MNNINKNCTFVPKCSTVHSLSQQKILLDDRLCSTEKKKFNCELKCQEQNVKFIYMYIFFLYTFCIYIYQYTKQGACVNLIKISVQEMKEFLFSSNVTRWIYFFNTIHVYIIFDLFIMTDSQC